MCDYPFFIPQVVLFANSSLFWFKVTNEHREFRNYLNFGKEKGPPNRSPCNLYKTHRIVFSTVPTSFRAIGRVSDAAITIVQIQLSGERNSPGFRYCPGRCLCRCTEKQTRSKEALWAIRRTFPDWKSSSSPLGSGSPDARSTHLVSPKPSPSSVAQATSRISKLGSVA